jgi:predicted anti-sigma-YlaC factor YlaD
MKALEFVKMMNDETQGNTDIYAGTWATMRRIAAHYDQCRECRDAFDYMEYDEEDLLEMAARIELTNEADWVCTQVIGAERKWR